MLNPFRRKIPQLREQTLPQKPKTDENCKIKVKRDQQGRAREISFSGKCSKTEVEIAKRNLDMEEDN